MTRWTTKDVNSLQGQQKPQGWGNGAKQDSGAAAGMHALGRLRSGEMNKTEKRYADHLEALKTSGDVLWWSFEPMNLRLGAKCFYAVDFLVLLKNGQIEAHEVKGYWTDDALVKIKVAAEKFPFRFVAARWVKKEWEYREF